MISWQIIYYLMLIQRQLIQHLAAFISDNKSAPCKRKFRGTFVPVRAHIAPKFILPRALPVVIPFFAYFGNGRIFWRDFASRFFVFPLAIFDLIGDTASKICVTIMSRSRAVDKHLTLSGKQSRFRAPIPQWAHGRSNTIFAPSTGNSTVLMRCHNYGGYITVANCVIRFCYSSISTSRARSIHFQVIISRGPYVCANNIRFCQIGNGARRGAPFRYDTIR